MRWVGWGHDTGCAPVPARHPQGGGGRLLSAAPPPYACGGLDGGTTLAAHLCLPGIPRGGGRLLSPPPPLYMRGVGWRDDTGGALVPTRHPQGFGLWACLPDPKRALGAQGVPLIWEVRVRRTSLTLIPRGLGAGHTPPSAVVRVLVQVGGQVEGVQVLGEGG